MLAVRFLSYQNNEKHRKPLLKLEGKWFDFAYSFKIKQIENLSME